eukprot:Nitzschia sp. Nitz4//scaffold215_size37433//3922//5594//NITZ4_007744-RA/size37433-processed-gene-0.45-mRNA-1//-1//CDS//3329542130//6311//frame0
MLWKLLKPWTSKSGWLTLLSLIVLTILAFSVSRHDFLTKTTTVTIPTNDALCTPQRLHLAQASNVHNGFVNMTVSFTLPFKTCHEVQPTLYYGHGFQQFRTQTSERLQFAYDASVAVPDLHYESDWIHHMTMTVQAGRLEYWYQVVLPHGLSSHNSFTTPPLPHQPTSLALLGDLGQTENSTKTMQHILHATQVTESSIMTRTGALDKPPKVSGMLLAGDLSYADGDPRRWESWMDLMEPLLQRTPLQSAAGNHEIECDNTTHTIFSAYENYFRHPNRIAPAEIEPVDPAYQQTLWRHQCLTSSEFLGHYNYGNAFYAFEHGLAHVIVLNSFADTSPSSPQYKWLVHHLQQPRNAPWLLVMFHVPPHTTFVGHFNETNARYMYHHIEPLMVQYKVDLVISGHDHAYLRTKPMRGGASTKSGPVYLTLGAGGNREQHSKGYLHPEPEEWVAVRDNLEYGYGHLYMVNDTHAHFHWVRNGQHGVGDAVWFQKEAVQDPSSDAAAWHMGSRVY